MTEISVRFIRYLPRGSPVCRRFDGLVLRVVAQERRSDQARALLVAAIEPSTEDHKGFRVDNIGKLPVLVNDDVEILELRGLAADEEIKVSGNRQTDADLR